MRHRVKGRKLGRKAAHRKATMRALTKALVKEKRIVTTVAKAKELRVFIEPLITAAKNDTMHNRNIVFSALQDKETVKALFGEVAEKVGDRPGGYTRIIKAGTREGDGAELAVIELVDFNESDGGVKAAGKKRTRRSRSSGVKKQAAPKAEKAKPEASKKEEAKAEKPETEAQAEAEVKAAEAAEPAAEAEEIKDAAADANTEGSSDESPEGEKDSDKTE